MINLNRKFGLLVRPTNFFSEKAGQTLDAMTSRSYVILLCVKVKKLPMKRCVLLVWTGLMLSCTAWNLVRLIHGSAALVASGGTTLPLRHASNKPMCCCSLRPCLQQLSFLHSQLRLSLARCCPVCAGSLARQTVGQMIWQGVAWLHSTLQSKCSSALLSQRLLGSALSITRRSVCMSQHRPQQSSAKVVRRARLRASLAFTCSPRFCTSKSFCFRKEACMLCTLRYV